MASSTLSQPSGHGKQVYFMPSEEELHEGTWLQWPHNCGWDNRHIKRYEESWIQMAQALHSSERVHIIVYNRRQLRRVRNGAKIVVNQDRKTVAGLGRAEGNLSTEITLRKYGAVHVKPGRFDALFCALVRQARAYG